MADYGVYCDRRTYKLAIGLIQQVDDAEILRRLEEASRWVDEKTGRHYYVKTATKYFTAEESEILDIDDLLSITTLKTDEDGDRVYETTWATTDYDLEPYNKLPYIRIQITPNGDYVFPTVRKSIEIAGLWGYGDGQSATPYIAAGCTATLADASTTTMTTSEGSNLAAGNTILVDSEQIYLAEGDGLSWEVVRGVNGTTAEAHSAKAISVYQYPRQIRDAVLMQTARLLARRDSRFATQIGNADTGTTTIFRGKDEDIEAKLRPFKRDYVGAF